MKTQSIIGQSAAFLSVLDKTSRLAPIDRPVLVLGERGTGKELIAQRLHYLSRRWQRPLISLNCSALSEQLIDSELFGHESGAFTGAKAQHKGRFERAENGSLFLDELATTPFSVQEKLLRVIEYGEYERVGGNRTLTANVRLICATNAHLPELAQQGRFRADLLDRLAFDVIHLPPLRARQEDILLLAEHFAIHMCQELSLPFFVGFSSRAQKALLHYSWPGNIRELKNVVERAVYQHSNKESKIDELVFNPFQTTDFETVSDALTLVSAPVPSTKPQSSSSTTQQAHSMDIKLPIDYKAWQAQQEQELLTLSLEHAKFNQRHAAQLLGLSYHQFRGMLRKHHKIEKNTE